MIPNELNDIANKTEKKQKIDKSCNANKTKIRG